MIPLEIVQRILLLLPPKTCWTISRSLGLRMNFCLRYCLPRIPVLSMDVASELDRVAILDWWKVSRLELKYTFIAMNLASCYGHIHVLDWWITSGLELKYTAFAIDGISHQDGHVNALEWWLASGLELKYTACAMDWASRYGHIKVIDWWRASGLELKYTH